MLTARKVVSLTENKNNIIKLHDSKLEKYLSKFDIANHDFSFDSVDTKTDAYTLRKYYDANLKRANTLVTDDEFVGKTFDNLDIIGNLIENKLVIKR